MLDARGGPKALHSALVRDWSEAAAMAARVHSAAKAIELGYAIEPDGGETGRARDWRIVGIPQQVCDLFSKRKDEIEEYLDDKGYTGYRARNVAARATRDVKRHTGVDELMPQWVAELEALGWTVNDLTALENARRQATGLAARLTDTQIDRLAADLLDPEGDFSTRWKLFSRKRLVAEIAPLLYGHHPDELDYVVDRIIRSELVVPLIGVPGVHEQHYATAAVLANEEAIAQRVEHLATAPGPALPAADIADAVRAKEAEIGARLSTGQRATIEAVCASGRAIELVVGVAGAGKTTALDAATTALATAGYRVLGTATSGQATRTLSQEAGIEASTMRSLLWRLDHHQLTLNQRSVVVLDEAGMTADADLARLLLAAERAGAKVVLVGDPRQLSPVGPGGALDAVLTRHPDIVTELTENKRQRDPDERAMLAQFRNGHIDQAIDFYQTNNRIHVAPTRAETLGAMVNASTADTLQGRETLMLAHQRVNVAALNRIARATAGRLGWLTGPELTAPGGRHYAAGDPVVLLAPNHDKNLVTSQRGTVTLVDPDEQSATLTTEGGRRVSLAGEEIDNEHLDHAYAMTVHRVQGATSDRTHLYADGGGQQLAYVALSRARDSSTIHAAAPDLDEALDDIRYDWTTNRAQQWVTDTAQPGHDPSHEPASETPRDRSDRLLADARDEIARIRARLDALQHRPTSRHLDPPRQPPSQGLGL